MAEYTLENTWPLLEEIRKRMGSAWEPEPTAEQIEREWHARGGQSISAADLLGGRKAAGDVLKMMGHAPRLEDVSTELLRQREARMRAAKAEAEASLRRDLRGGLWVAIPRGPNGLAAEIAAHLWDSTQADAWLLEGRCDTGELRLGKIARLPEKPVRRGGGHPGKEYKAVCIGELAGFYASQGLPTKNREIEDQIWAWVAARGEEEPAKQTVQAWAKLVRTRAEELKLQITG